LSNFDEVDLRLGVLSVLHEYTNWTLLAKRLDNARSYVVEIDRLRHGEGGHQLIALQGLLLLLPKTRSQWIARRHFETLDASRPTQTVV